MAGMRDIAKLAGVSLSTVSVVLADGKKKVSDSNRQKVLEAVRTLNYQNPPKRQDTRKTVAVVLPVLTSSFFTNVFSGIEVTLSEGKNLILYYNSNYNFDKEIACLKTLKKQMLAGIIINSICPINKELEYLDWLKREFIDHNIPVVLLEREVTSENFYCVFVDNQNSAYIATEHLINQGHTKIAHISGNELTIQYKDRLTGYKNALRDHGISFDPELVRKGDFTPLSGYLAMKQLLNIRSDFSAVFSANDQMAIGSIKAIKEYGKSVPKDVAVVGFDNLSVTTLIEPSLSTVNVPAYQMGKVAAGIILDVSEGKTCLRTNKLPTNLIVRRSSDGVGTNEWVLTGW